MLTNDIVSFEQLGPSQHKFYKKTYGHSKFVFILIKQFSISIPMGRHFPITPKHLQLVTFFSFCSLTLFSMDATKEY